MNILEILIRLRDDIKLWVTNNILALKEEIDRNKFSKDYNDLINKPCYDISNTEEKFILFDGNTDGLESVDSGAVSNLKISDEIVYKDDLVGGTINTNGNISTIVEEDIVEPNIFQSGEAFSYNNILFVQEDVVTPDYNTLSAGVWITSTTNIFTINYSKTATSFKQLDEKFIPDTIARTDHIHNYNDLADKPVKILNGFTTPVNLKELLQTEMYGAYIINGYFSYSNGSGAASYAPSKYFVRTVPGVESIAGTVYFDNMYVVYDANWNYTVYSYATNTKINEIESKLNNKANKSDVPNIVVLTQEDYDDLEAAGTVNPDTYYLINEEE